MTELEWTTAHAACAHAYLWPTISAIVRGASSAHPDRRPVRILDAGCGNGYITGRLSDLGFSVAGCDISRSGIALARDAYPDIRYEACSVYDDLGARFGREWDIVLSLEVIEHLYDPRRFARNVHDLLRPGGMFIVSTPYHGYAKYLALALLGKMDRHMTALWDGGHIKFFSRATLSAILTETGFKDIRFHGSGRLPYLWKSMVLTGRT